MERKPVLSVKYDPNAPYIEVIHYDRSDDLADKMIGYFIKMANAGQIKVERVNGYLEAGTKNSFETYKLVIDKKEPFSLKDEVFNLANKLAIAGYGDQAVKMQTIHNSLLKK